MNVTKTHIIIAIAIVLVSAAGGFGAGYYVTRGQFSNQLETARGQVEELEKSNARLREANRDLGNSIDRLEGTVENLRGTLGDLRETNNDLRESLEGLRGRIDDAEGTLREIAAGVSGSIGDIDELIEFVGRLREQLQSYFETT